MIAAVDVHYVGDDGTAACVLFDDWGSDWPAAEYLARVRAVAPYAPGRFAERELPGLLAVLAVVDRDYDVVIVDGYVQLDARGREGLGAHLHDALGGRVPVIGVAKTPFDGADHAVAIRRGDSVRPLYVTAAGLDVHDAAARITAMHGAHRVPTLLTWVDQLAKRS